MIGLNRYFYFKPRIGSYYPSGGIFGRKIMVLGESHYCSSDCKVCGMIHRDGCENITSDVIDGYLDQNNEREEWMNTYLKFERSLVGHKTTLDESRQIWDSVLFYNFLQVAMRRPRQAGMPDEYSAAAEPFYEVMAKHQPDILIVWGTRLWKALPADHWMEGEPVDVDGYSVSNGWYLLQDGKKVRAVCVYHPSVGYSWDFWNKVITKFL